MSLCTIRLLWNTEIFYLFMTAVGLMIEFQRRKLKLLVDYNLDSRTEGKFDCCLCLCCHYFLFTAMLNMCKVKKNISLT